MRESSVAFLASRWPRSRGPFVVSSSMGSLPEERLAEPDCSR